MSISKLQNVVISMVKMSNCGLVGKPFFVHAVVKPRKLLPDSFNRGFWCLEIASTPIRSKPIFRKAFQVSSSCFCTAHIALSCKTSSPMYLPYPTRFSSLAATLFFFSLSFFNCSSNSLFVKFYIIELALVSLANFCSFLTCKAIAR